MPYRGETTVLDCFPTLAGAVDAETTLAEALRARRNHERVALARILELPDTVLAHGVVRRCLAEFESRGIPEEVRFQLAEGLVLYGHLFNVLRDPSSITTLAVFFRAGFACAGRSGDDASGQDPAKDGGSDGSAI